MSLTTTKDIGSSVQRPRSSLTYISVSQRWTKHIFSSSVCPEVSAVEAFAPKMSSSVEAYTFVLWPSLEAVKSLQFK